MEDFRKSLYSACRQMGLHIVPMDVGARVMAFVGLQGGDERMVVCPRVSFATGKRQGRHVAVAIARLRAKSTTKRKTQRACRTHLSG